MKLSAAFAFFVDLRAAIFTASVPTLRDVYRAPSLLLQPRQLSRNFFTHVWVVFGDPTDEGGREVKVDLITPNAKGVVLDLGAGGYSVYPQYHDHVVWLLIPVQVSDTR